MRIADVPALLALLALLAAAGAPAVTAQTGAAGLELITDEADAALAILEARQAGRAVSEAAWGRLFGSEGYRRLKARESAMGRAFEDSSFRAFLLSDTLLRRAPDLARTLTAWRAVPLERAAARARAYLPEGARLRARVYLLIKPRTNSFVFEAATDPAIMLYLDPAVTPAQLENTVAHELHHIGYAGACADGPEPADSAVAAARQWLGAFGEGVAMLAAAGGPGIHPHAVSPPEERARWDRDVAGAGPDLRRVERFLLDILEGRLTQADSTRAAGMAFFGVQGPWYTVGWLMASTIERSDGRDALIGVLCDPPALLRRYNEAASRSGARLPRWSDTLLDRLSAR